jgi:restriction system protein
MNGLDFIKTFAPIVYLPLLAFLIIAAAFHLIKIYLYRRKLNKLARAGIGDIDKMDGRTFEQYVEAIYGRKGYQARRTPYRGDFGGDLVVEKGGVKKVVQAKRWKRKVGVKAIQEAVAAKGYYDCDAAVVISNSDFTLQAMELAQNNGVMLVGRKALLGEFVALSETSKVKDIYTSTSAEYHCSNCGKRLTTKEIAYCDRFKDRFQGKMLCYACQRIR